MARRNPLLPSHQQAIVGPAQPNLPRTSNTFVPGRAGTNLGNFLLPGQAAFQAAGGQARQQTSGLIDLASLPSNRPQPSVLQPSTQPLAPSVPSVPDVRRTDPQIEALRRRLGDVRFEPGQFSFDQPFQFQPSDDPRLLEFINQLQAGLGNTQSRIESLMQQLQAAGNQPFQFDDSRFAQLRHLISQIQRGEGIGPIDVESDPEAAAFRVALERQAQRERSALAERLSATGGLRTGAGQLALLEPGRQAGRNIAGFEAALAGRRRGEVLAQRLQGAQLGLEELSGERNAALQAFQAQQAARLSGLQGSLQAALSGTGQSQQALVAAMLQRQQTLANQRQQAFNEFETLRRGAFETFEQVERERLQRAELARQALQDQLAVLTGQQGRRDTLTQQQFQNELRQRELLLQQRREELERRLLALDVEERESDVKEKKRSRQRGNRGLAV